MSKKRIPAHIKAMRAVRDKRIEKVRGLLSSQQQVTTRDVSAILGVSSVVANSYLQELRAHNEATIIGKEVRGGAGRSAYVWAPTVMLGRQRPWYRRALDWLTGDSDIKVPV
jgi:predicted ArsR family transcriptional regulator